MTLRTHSRLLVLTVGAGVVVAFAFRNFPLADDLAFDAAALGLPLASKLPGVVRSLLALAAVNLAALAFGRPFQRWLVPGARSVFAAVLRLGFGFLVLADLVFLLAALHLLDGAALKILVLAPSALGAYQVGQALLRLPRPLFRFRDWPTALAAGLFLSPLLSAFVPIYGWDARVYHLAVPERYLFENGIWASSSSFYSAFPLTMQMLYVLALAFDLTPLAKLLHLELGVLTVLAAALLAHRRSRRAAGLAVVILAADPLLFWEMGLAYADLAGCFYALLAVAMLAEARPGEHRGLVAAGVFAGAALAVHYRLAVVVAGLLGAVWWPRWQRRPVELVRTSAILAGVAALVVLPWLARNLVLFGNPVAPALQSVFHAEGEEYFEPIAVAQSVELALRRGPGRDPVEFLLLPWRLTTGKDDSGEPLYSFPVGCLHLVGFAACLLCFGRAGPLEKTFFRVALLAVTLWFWSGAQESRYVLPMLVLLAIPGGMALDRLLPRAGGRHWPLLAVLAIAVVHGQWTSLHNLPWRWGYALGPLSVDDLETQDPAAIVGRRLREKLTPDDRLLLLFEGRGYFFRGLDYVPYHVNEGSPTLQLIHRAADVAALDRTLEELGVTHVLVNLELMNTYQTVLVPGYQQADFERDVEKISTFINQRTEPYLSDRHVIVHKISRPPP